MARVAVIVNADDLGMSREVNEATFDRRYQDIIGGKADENTLSLLEKLAKAVQVGSLCGLGKTAPNPVL